MTPLAPILAAICKTQAGKNAAVIYAPWLEQYMAQFKINTKRRAAMFLTEVAHESGEFTRVSENLNYSADGLAATWKRFRGNDGRPNALATKLARKPEAIANCVYANRMGNGDETSGDGWRTRGMGLIQTTGTDVRLEMGEYFGVDFIANHELLMEPQWAVASACWYWWKHGLNEIADTGNLDHASDVINIGHVTTKIGDAIGYPDRAARFRVVNAVVPEGFSL